MRTRAMFAIPVALLLAAGCTDSEPTESMADRCAQVEGAIDALTLDVGNHMAEIGATDELTQVFAVERRHYTRTVRDLENVHDWLRTMEGCTNDDGDRADTAAMIYGRWNGRVVAAVHKQMMLVAPDVATAQREEERYQLAMLDVVAAMRRDLVDLDLMAPDYSCLPLEARNIEPAPHGLTGPEMAPEAAPSPLATHDVHATELALPAEPMERAPATLTARELAPVDTAEIPAGPKWARDPDIVDMAPEPPAAMDPAPEWMTPPDVGPPVSTPQAMDGERLPVEHAPANPLVEAPADLLQVDRAFTDDASPLRSHDGTPVEMAPVPMVE